MAERSTIDSVAGRRSRLGLGLFCAALVAFAISVPLGCVPAAARIGGASLLAGAALGAALAAVTRTRRPIAIYGWLIAAACTLLPLALGWPASGPEDVQPWRDAPDIVYFYPDMLRPLMFLLGAPYPFVRFGYHAPDPREG